MNKLKDLKEHLRDVSSLINKSSEVEIAASAYNDALTNYKAAVLADLSKDNEVESTVLAQRVESAKQDLADKVAELFDLESNTQTK